MIKLQLILLSEFRERAIEEDIQQLVIPQKTSFPSGESLKPNQVEVLTQDISIPQ